MPEFISRSRRMAWLFAAVGIASAMRAAAADLADPTRPSGYSENISAPERGSEKLTLTLIRLGAEPQAVINGKTVAPGESIAGYRLLSLQTASAILTGPNGRTVLRLTPVIRQPSSTVPIQKH